MGLEQLTDREAVVAAIEKFNRVGGPAFRKEYGFNRSKRFFVKFDGSLYDSKPVLAAAHGIQFPNDGPLTPSAFQGGRPTLKRLAALGFETVDRDLRPVHVILKWQPDKDPATVDKHLATAAEHDGKVWWGSFTTGTSRTASKWITQLRKQIAADTPTFAYVYRSGPQPVALRARIHQVTNDRADVDEERVPSYYSTEQRHKQYALLSDFEPVDVGWMRSHLVRAEDPVPGSLVLRTQTSPLFVVESGGVEVLPEEPALPEVDDEEDEVVATELTLKWLVDETLWTEEAISEVVDSVSGTNPQVILAGPPGTGKTWVAQAIARFLTGDRDLRWKLVQFHPSYGYESFIEGLRPVLTDEGIKFDVVPGTVKVMAEEAEGTPGPHLIIIDELNRANIPRVLGELMYLFEYRDQQIDLQHSADFSLPPNLGFIATMNTADRSIRSIDVALRRRFEIYECLPDEAILRAFYKAGLGVNHVDDLFDGFLALNSALEAERDRHHTIGHTFFMIGTMSPARLRQIWLRKISPLIEEYFFDQPDLAKEFSIEKFWPSVGQ